jgi:sugar phosphate isomerase/epimerase
MRKIGISLQERFGLPDEEFAKIIKGLGFSTTFTRVFEERRQCDLANIFAKYGIEYENLHSPFGHINDIWLDTEAGEHMLKELLHSVDHCVMANVAAMVVHMSSGNTPPPITDIGRARYEKLVEYAIQHNVKLAFENLRKTANLAWVLETFDKEPMVGFCWDCGHEACYQNGREFMPWYGEKLICTHIHDNCGEKDADDHLLPFDGVINFERFAEHIRNSGYTGSFTLEGDNIVHRYDGWSAEKYLTKAAEVMKKLVVMTDGNAV